MNKIIDITTTATIRPELLHKAYDTFWKNIFSESGYDFRLIINIDPIGDNTYCQEDVLNVAKQFFPSVVCNCPPKKGFDEYYFPSAVKWVWSNCTSDYVFHLEDMWVSMEPIDINEMVYILDNYSKIACVNLHKYVLSDGAAEPTFYEYHSKKDRRLFLDIEDPLLSPGLYRGNFVREISKLMNETDNPELQIWGDKEKPNDGLGSGQRREYLKHWDYAIYASTWHLPLWLCSHPSVNMFGGREWKEKHNIYKKNHFSPWVKTKSV